MEVGGTGDGSKVVGSRGGGSWGVDGGMDTNFKYSNNQRYDQNSHMHKYCPVKMDKNLKICF